ncbi:hypothetical protein VNO77_43244 [Canavalia gladiata]|uniref:Uncharacterized protein n=1 Tax=Canavalia gladiata TaxID=3824 RepID=A0AAN9JVZ7_CANGL
MAPNKQKRIAAACAKMKEFGISKVKVKKAVEDLLEVYCNNWEFIEEDNYRVLIDAVLEIKNENKGTECNQKEAGSTSKKNVRVCLSSIFAAHRTFFLSINLSFSNPRRQQYLKISVMFFLLSYVFHNAMHQYICKACHSYEMMVDWFVQEVKSQKEAQKHDDPLIFEVKKKRLRPKNQKGKVASPVKKLKTSLMLEKDEGELSSGSQTSEEDDGEHLVKNKTARNKMQVLFHEDGIYHGDRFCSWPAKNSLTGQEDGLSSCEDCEPQRKRSRAYNNKENDRDFLDYQRHRKTPPFSEFSFGKQQPETCTDQTLTENILDFYHNDCPGFPSGEAYDCDLPLDEVPLKLIHPAAYTGNSNVTKDEAKFLQFEHLNVNDRSSRVSSTSPCDIASSSKGEVKVSLMYNPSQYYFHIPSMDDVLNAVEEKYKLPKILDSDFSVKKLMSDVCQCFLAMAAPSSIEKGFGTNDMSLLKELDGKYDAENNFCIHLSYSNCLASFCNLVKIVPQIPNVVALTGLEGLHYICGFRIPDTVDTHSHRERKIKILDAMEFANSSIVPGNEKDRGSYAAKCCYIDDITRGEEKVKISLVNSFCAEQLPTFYYIKHNIIYDKANVKFSLACISDVECCSHCFGDCLAMWLPCACAHITGGEYAYTQEGLLKEKFLKECISVVKDPKEHNFFYCKKCPVEMSKNKQKVKHCKEHLLPKFIKECWSKCGCNKNCGNRVVQRGITANLQVFWTPEGKGWGIRTLEDLPKGAFVCEYVGEVVTNIELYERTVQSRGEEKKHMYAVPLNAEWCSKNILKDEEALCLDATMYGNVARFINHRCTDAILIAIPVEVETPDHHYYHVWNLKFLDSLFLLHLVFKELAFFAQRKVAAMEELTWDYGIDFSDHDHSLTAFRCLCNSPLCRDQRLKK